MCTRNNTVWSSSNTREASDSTRLAVEVFCTVVVTLCTRALRQYASSRSWRQNSAYTSKTDWRGIAASQAARVSARLALLIGGVRIIIAIDRASARSQRAWGGLRSRADASSATWGCSRSTGLTGVRAGSTLRAWAIVEVACCRWCVIKVYWNINEMIFILRISLYRTSRLMFMWSTR